LGGFEALDHTADVGIAATGDSLAEALSWAATGMFSIIVNLETVQYGSEIEVSVSSTDSETLVVDWLNELLFRYEADGFLPSKFHVTTGADGTSLSARCLGEPVKTERHALLTAVKAATYHDLKVTHNGIWRIQVVLDV
jgi:SHS2 domain-containing protein